MPAGKTAPNHQFAGTPTFCSVAVDKGEQPGAYDDLEALVSSSVNLLNEAKSLDPIISFFRFFVAGIGAGVPDQRRYPSLVRIQI